MGVPRALVSAISELSLKDATVGAFAVAFAPAAAAAHACARALVSAISELSLKDATVGAFAVAFAPAAAAAHARRASGARERYLRAIFEGVPRALVSAISELSLKDATVGAFAVAFAPAAAAAHARRASGARERYLRAIFEGVPRALVSAISELSLKDATVGAFAVAFALAAAAAHARRASGARERYLRAIFEGVPRALVSAISELSLKDATVGAFAVAFAPAAAAAHARRASGARERYLRAIFEGRHSRRAVAFLRPPPTPSAISELSLKDATVGAFAVAFAPAAAAAHARRASGARERYLRAIFEGVPRALVSAISELSLKDATVGAFAVAFAPAAAAPTPGVPRALVSAISELSLKDATVGVPRALVSAISELSLKDATVGAFAVAFAPAAAAPTPGVPRALVSAISELSLKDATVGAFAVAFAPAAAAAHARRASGARERYLRAIFEGVPRALVSAISELSLKDATVGVPRALVSAISELSLKDATVGAFAVAFARASGARERYLRAIFEGRHSVPRALVSAISELSLKDATVGAFAVAFARASGARERYLRAIFEGRHSVPRALVSAISELFLKDATVGAFAVAFARASGARERYLRAIFEGRHSRRASGDAGFVMGDGAVMECCFSPWDAGKHAQAKYNGQCQRCSPVRMQTICKTQRLSKLASHSLANLQKLDAGIYDIAVERVAMCEGGDELISRAKEIVAKNQQAAAPAKDPVDDQGDVVMELVEEVPGGAPDAAELPPPPPAVERTGKRLCEGYALGRAMGRKLKGKGDCGVCAFSRAEPSERALAAGGHCVFCTPARMKEAAQNFMKKKHVMADLNKFKQASAALHAKALGRLRRHLTLHDYKVLVTPHHCCRGAGEHACPFSTANPGQPARVLKEDKHLCSWCDPQRLRGMQGVKRSGLLKQLKAFREKDEAVFDKAEAILKSVYGDDYVAQMRKKTVRQNQQAARAQRARRRSGKTDWPEKLKRRALQMQNPADDREARKKFRRLTLENHKKVENSFFKDKAERRVRGRADEIPKGEELDPPLEAARFSDLSKGLESWALRGSWGMCKECSVLQPRPMHEVDMFRDASEEISKSACRRCSASRKMFVPLPEQVPKKLRGLSEEAVEALSPIDIDVGPETRSTDKFGRPNGYRKKVKMITFYFSRWHVRDKIKEIEDKEMRHRAKRALEYLLSCEDSS
ncbi:unnamed protein product [Prorocentrum cordatum]|uniref:HEAT repeat-containing protein 1 n=1 Tax=Prorocentrum cordatum TaxID=2364126 RepID=A0ABN9SU39_9DINO|nr:unnamed protein product [Polarella glacialis]